MSSIFSLNTRGKYLFLHAWLLCSDQKIKRLTETYCFVRLKPLSPPGSVLLLFYQVSRVWTTLSNNFERNGRLDTGL